MTQLNLLSKHVMGGGLKTINGIGRTVGQCPYDVKFEALL